MRKIKKALFSLFACVIALLVVFGTGIGNIIVPSALAEGAVVSFKADQYTVKTGSTGNINFEITLSQTLSSAVTVYYHTENLSAIGGIDFTAVENGSVTISAGKTSAIIVVSTKEAPFGTVNGDVSKVANINSREFVLRLDKTDTSEVTIDPQKNTAKGKLAANFLMPIETKDKVTYAKEYNNNLKAEMADKKLGHGSTYRSGVLLTAPASWQKYVDTFGSKVYGTFTCENVVTHYTLFSQDRPGGITLGDYQFATEDLDYFEGEADGNLAWIKFETNEEDSTRDSNIFDANVQKQTFERGSSVSGSNYMDVHSLWRKPGYKTIGDKVYFPVDPKSGVYGLGVLVKNRSSDLTIKLTFEGVKVFMCLQDDTAPTVVSTYVDDSALAKDRSGKLRFMMRFSEPVQVAGTPKVNVIFNDQVTGSTFTYVAGSGSDTLCFEGDPIVGKVYTSYRYKFEPTNSTSTALSQIHDFSYCDGANNQVQKVELKSFTTIKKDGKDYQINYTKPVISLEQTSKGSYATQHSFNIVVSGCGSSVVYTYLSPSREMVNASSDFKYLAPLTDGGSIHTLTERVMDDKFYKFNVLAVSPYGLTNIESSGQLQFDNIKPNLDVSIDKAENKLAQKTFSIEYSDNYSISKLYILIKDPLDPKNILAKVELRDEVLAGGGSSSRDPSEEEEDPEAPIDPGETSGEESEDDIQDDDQRYQSDPRCSVRYNRLSNTYKGKYYSALYMLDEEYHKTDDIFLAMIPKDDTICNLMGDELRKNFIICFEVVDICGNVQDSDDMLFTYDIRAGFDAIVTIEGEDENEVVTEILPEEDVVETTVYNIFGKEEVYLTVSTPDEGGYLTVKVEKFDPETTFTEVIGTLSYNEEEKVDYVVGTGNAVKVSGLKAGWYRLTPTFTKTSQGGKDEILTAGAIEFYVTDGKKEKTYNYEKLHGGSLALINLVYQLPSDVPFYYLGAVGSDKAEVIPYGAKYDEEYGRYLGGSTAPSFSSIDKLTQYVRYMEYQDLYLVRINASQANYLNGTGINNFVKATNEKHFAREGELWIRYKQMQWVPGQNSSRSSYNWVYYYYGPSTAIEEIDLSQLPSDTLVQALETVVATIVSKNVKTHLVETNTMTNGMPKLTAQQIHVVNETATQTMMGNPFSEDVTFSADKKIYDDYVTYEGESLPLGSNLFIKASKTFLYYRYVDSQDWTYVVAKDGEALRNTIPNATSGVYEIREIDENGMREYRVYLDTNAPRIYVTIKMQRTPVDPGDQTLTLMDFQFESMVNELDPYAYVAVFNSSYKLLNVFDSKTMVGESLSGSYYIRVGDRSGNYYDIKLLMPKESLKATLTPNPSGNGIVVTCNRARTEIYRYEVKLNGVLIDTEYDVKKTYKESGVYNVRIVDIYGDTFEDDISFNRKAPEITWYYLNTNGYYNKYDRASETQPIQVVSDEIMSNHSNVYTSKELRLVLSDDLGTPKFTISGLEEGEYTVVGGKTININVLKSWSITVSYVEYPDCYEVYTCIPDVTPPDITVSYLGSDYNFTEYLAMANDFQTVPKTLRYELGNVSVQYIYSNQVINADEITIYATDERSMGSLVVYVNGRPVSTTDGKRAVRLDNMGEYRVVATDRYGNVRIVVFENNVIPYANFGTDDEKTIEEDPSLTEPLYGNTTAYTMLNMNAEVEMLVYSENQDKTYYHYSVQDGVIFRGNYQVVTSDAVQAVDTVWEDEPCFSSGIENFRYGDWYELEKTDSYTVLVRLSSKGVVTFAIQADDGDVTAEVRAYLSSGKEPSYRLFKLSKICSDVPVFSGNVQIATNQNGTLIFANGELTLGDIPENIARVEVAYSDSMKFKDYATIYEIGDKKDFVGKEMGFYSIRVINLYGNACEYIINYTLSGQVFLVATYADESEFVYTSEYSGVVRSNYSITIQAYGEQSIYVNGKICDVPVVDGVEKFTIFLAGEYEITVIDRGGASVKFNAQIGTKAGFAFDPTWIEGYPDDLNVNSEYFTKDKHSINVEGSSVYSVTITVGEETFIVYDKLSQFPTEDAELLQNCIGKYGNGLYVVNFRSAYGDLAKVLVNYRETPTLIITRVTALNGEEEECDVNDVVTTGIYASNSIKFSSVAVNGKFTVNGLPASLINDYALEYNAMSGDASFEYTITYSDEYGFSYEFKAILLRRVITIDTSAMKVVELGGVKYTTDNVKIAFADDYTATVSYGSTISEPYASGDVLRKDLTYTFIVSDVAGNFSAYKISRNSYCKYQFVDGSSQREVVSGSVANSTVTFNALNSSTRIAKVFRNGIEQKEKLYTSFRDAGHWEIMLEDDIGNTSYFEFYLITHSLGKFEYEAPYGYTVSEVWYTDALGNREPSIQKGKKIVFMEDGVYSVVMTSEYGTVSLSFAITIDTAAPKATLVGVEDGGVTAQVVSLANLTVGDVVHVYLNDVLVQTLEVNASSDNISLSEGGEYKVVVLNEANVEISYTFTKKYIANTAASVLVIVLSVALVSGLFIGLLYRNRSRTDK